MPISWSEIKARASIFSKEWENETSEDAEAKSFWDEFFNVFGISRRRVATFEQQVRKINDKPGFIDLLWKGVLLIEHKSRGKNLDKAFGQAKDYFPGLTEKELPRYILVSDFARFRLYDLENGSSYDEFEIIDLVNHVHLFGFVAGYQKRTYKEQDPVNIEAAELMGKLHDKLRDIGYSGHYLEVYLVRLVFCLFADDTNIFEKGIFYDYLDLKTNDDGSDLSGHIAQIFETLDTPPEKRLKNLDETLMTFPYVNGKLFEERLPMASFDKAMRKILIDCCLLDWGKISPAIFGSLFQSVMDTKARRNLGAHYTSEINILKVIRPLFLDNLWKEFEKVKREGRPSLETFHTKLSSLRFLDPACGCGNFLIIAYRELRLLEIEVIKVLLFKYEKLRAEVAADAGYNVGLLIKCDVDKFYGIEYEEFPAQIAQVAMWLIDHQMNQLVSETFGDYYVRLPLRKSATIRNGNALQIKWQGLIETNLSNKGIRFNYILSNPPFIGKTWQSDQQRKDLESIFLNVKGSGLLDYVTSWYLLAAQYIKLANSTTSSNQSKTVAAFVSTNSISQGEQVSILWNELLFKYGVKIHFAHQTFRWSNEARGEAAVHCIIVGFSDFESAEKYIYEYDNIKGEPHEIKARNINPYLVDGKDILIRRRSIPICKSPKMIWGNKPVDGGHLIFTREEKDAFIKLEPGSRKYFKRFIGGQEFIQNIERWCLWLVDADPSDLRRLKYISDRVSLVRITRLESNDPGARKLAERPTQFRDLLNPKRFIAVPEVSSERRKYIPIGFLDENVIASNKLQIIPDGSLFDFCILTSLMHMTWMRYTCGRLESRYSYSNSIVYNNFPWPEVVNDKQRENILKAGQHILEIRLKFPTSSLSDLYDPNSMPPILAKAHSILDKAVDSCYRTQPFLSESKRIEYLFELYDKYTSGFFAKPKKTTKKAK